MLIFSLYPNEAEYLFFVMKVLNYPNNNEQNRNNK